MPMTTAGDVFVSCSKIGPAESRKVYTIIPMTARTSPHFKSCFCILLITIAPYFFLKLVYPFCLYGCSFQSLSAVSFHSHAYASHFPHKCSTGSASSTSVECAPVSCTIRCKISGFSSIGHGRSMLSLNGWLSLYAMNNGCFKHSNSDFSRIFAPE